MTERIGQRRFGTYVLIVLMLVIGYRAVQMIRLNNEFLYVTDGESDKNCVSAARAYQHFGFGHNYGLPDLRFIPDASGTSTHPPFTYTHYPPGAELLAGLMAFPCGVSDIRCLRLLPFVFACLVMAYFLFFMGRILPKFKAAVLVTVLALTPLFSNEMAQLAFHNYQFYLLLLQMICMFRYSYLGEISLSKAALTLGFLSFLQGCFSLDYFFIANLIPLPFAVWLGTRERSKSWFILIAVSFAGYLSAFFIHFLQVVFYRGGWVAAIDDFVASGVHRRSGISGNSNWIDPANLNVLNVIRREIDVYIVHPQNFAFPAQLLILLVIGALCWKGKLAIGSLLWMPSRRAAMAIAACAIMSMMWCVFMPQHSYQHYFLARHYFLAYFFSWFFVLKNSANHPVGLTSNTIPLISLGS